MLNDLKNRRRFARYLIFALAVGGTFVVAAKAAERADLIGGFTEDLLQLLAWAVICIPLLILAHRDVESRAIRSAVYLLYAALVVWRTIDVTDEIPYLDNVPIVGDQSVLHANVQQLCGLLVGGCAILIIFRLFEELAANNSKLSASEERFRRLAENARDMIFRMSIPEGRYEYLSPACVEVSGYTAEEIRQRPMMIRNIIVPEWREGLGKVWKNVTEGHVPDTYEYPIIHKSGETRWLQQKNVLVRDESGRPLVLEGTIGDITERKRADEKLAQEHQRLEDLLLAHERDRRLMAYEIHDGLTQNATAALFHFEAVRQRCPTLPSRAEAEFDLGLKLVRSTVDEARSLISGLRPPIIDEQGVVASIEFLLAEYARHGGPDFEFIHNGPDERLDALLEGTIYRIAQEAVSNIARHSHAEKARISLDQHDGYLQLEVQDWGQGFKVEEANNARFGLRGIRERAKILGGTASIDSQPGHGTRILVRVPVKYARDSKRPSIA